MRAKDRAALNAAAATTSASVTGAVWHMQGLQTTCECINAVGLFGLNDGSRLDSGVTFRAQLARFISSAHVISTRVGR